jgi:hypothetical protein
MQDPSRLAVRPPVEHNRPLHASLSHRLAWVLLLLARRVPEAKCSISAPMRSSEDGQARDELQTGPCEKQTGRFPCEREATGLIPLFFNELLLSEKLFREFFGMTHVCSLAH